MGRDLKLQAIPADWPPFVQLLEYQSGDVNTQLFHGDALQLFLFILADMRDGYDGEESLKELQTENPSERQAKSEEFCQLGIQLIHSKPHLLGQFCELGRSFDHVIYLLQLFARNDHEKTLARKAVLPPTQVSQCATAGQGALITWLTPQEVKEIDGFLNRVDAEAFDLASEQFKISEIPDEIAIYKRGQFTERQIFDGYFSLRKFYDVAGESNHAAFMVCD